MTCATCKSDFAGNRHQVKRVASGLRVYCCVPCKKSYPQTRKPLMDRVNSWVNKSGPVPSNRPELGPCWIWLGAKNNKGYGVMSVRDGKPHIECAHRVTYISVHGSIPEGLELDHLCRVTCCCNPSHLEAVTHRENQLRGTSPFAIHAAKTHCIHGHEFTPQNTIKEKLGRKCRQCAKDRQAKRSMKSQREQGKSL